VSILIVADVHANLAAFEAAIEDAPTNHGPIDAIWSLGDLVGYGPQPRECIDLLRSFPHVAIAGNHDLAAAGLLGTEDFNPYATDAIEWTQSVLAENERRFLSAMPLQARKGDFTLVHGSLVDPVWDYLLRVQDTAAHFLRQETTYCLIGHSHLPLVFFAEANGARSESIRDGSTLELGEERFVANPGGLGQPRDGDPRAPYAVLDPDAKRLSFHRVAYPVEQTQARMRAVGLPSFLIDRLARGR